MVEPQDRDGGPPVDADTFYEWVEYTAEQRDVAEQELLNQLVSAFWVLDEMNQVAGDTDSPVGTDASSSSDPSRSEAENTTSQEFRPQNHRERSPTETDTDRSEPAPSGTERTTESPEEGSTVGENAGPPPEVATFVDEFLDSYDSVNTQVGLVREMAEVRRQLSDLSLDIEQQRSRQEAFTDRISDNLTRLNGRVGDLETRTEDAETADTEHADQLAAELSEDIAELEAIQSELESWIDEEFTQIEELFEHLLSVTDNLDDRVTAVESEIESLHETESAREKLRSFKRTARRAGVDHGVCETCDTKIDVSLLDAPSCPTCESEFIDIEPGSGWNPFAKSTFQTASELPDPADRFQ